MLNITPNYGNSRNASELKTDCTGVISMVKDDKWTWLGDLLKKTLPPRIMEPKPEAGNNTWKHHITPQPFELTGNIKLLLWSAWHKPIKSSPIVEQENPKTGTLQSSLTKHCLSLSNAITTLRSKSWTKLKLRMIPGTQTQPERCEAPSAQNTILQGTNTRGLLNTTDK
jgi:hypothetical protein